MQNLEEYPVRITYDAEKHLVSVDPMEIRVRSGNVIRWTITGGCANIIFNGQTRLVELVTPDQAALTQAVTPGTYSYTVVASAGDPSEPGTPRASVTVVVIIFP